jgi:hypothetical protein
LVSGLNTNLFYLVLLAATGAIALIVFRAPWQRLVTLAALTFFIFYNPPPPPPPAVYADLAEGSSFDPGKTRSYRFITAALRERTDCGDLGTALLRIYGKNLDGVQISTNAGMLAAIRSAPYFDLTDLRATLDLPQPLPAAILISISNFGSSAATIFRGPEISDSTLYADAVYMVITTPQCVVVLHAVAI